MNTTIESMLIIAKIRTAISSFLITELVLQINFRINCSSIISFLELRDPSLHFRVTVSPAPLKLHWSRSASLPLWSGLTLDIILRPSLLSVELPCHHISRFGRRATIASPVFLSITNLLLSRLSNDSRAVEIYYNI